MAAIACGDDDDSPHSPPLVQADASADGHVVSVPTDSGSSPSASKLDLLLVVDNSNFMTDKQEALARSLGSFFDGVGVNDIHVGVISTSVANGGDICDTKVNPRQDERAHLLNRAGYASDVIVSGAEAGFLSLGPSGTVPDKSTLTERTAELVRGVGEGGCGLEAQLESAYRFIADPNPFVTITRDATGRAELTGTDYELLAQRKAFLRPDSMVAVVLITDEDDASIDPRALGGFGYGFGSISFPHSLVQRGGTGTSTTAPRGTSTCVATPSSADCKSCFYAIDCDAADAECQKLRADPACKTSGTSGKSGDGYLGFLAPSDDSLNLRGYRMRERFGIDARFPLSRYVAAFQGKRLPARLTEHAPTGGANGTLGEYSQTEDCANPLFSVDLPSAAGDELCNLKSSGRDPRLVHFGLIAGAVPSLVGASPQWELLLGADPMSLTFAGSDPHMVPSTAARPPLTGADLPIGNNGSDPIHGREWNTLGNDLEYACSFSLPVPRSCSGGGLILACECYTGAPSNPPLCNGAGTAQIRAKALPSLRELALVEALGTQASVSSVCAEGASPYNPFLLDLARALAAHALAP